MLGQPADGAASAGPAVRVLETAAARESEEAAAGGDCLGSDYSTRIFCINLVGLLCQLCYSSGRLCYSCVSTGLQVLSDSNITPLLTMLGAAEMASRRPVWGSTLVFELSARPPPPPPSFQVCLRRLQAR